MCCDPQNFTRPVVGLGWDLMSDPQTFKQTVFVRESQPIPPAVASPTLGVRCSCYLTIWFSLCFKIFYEDIFLCSFCTLSLAASVLFAELIVSALLFYFIFFLFQLGADLSRTGEISDTDCHIWWYCLCVIIMISHYSSYLAMMMIFFIFQCSHYCYDNSLSSLVSSCEQRKPGLLDVK